MNALLHIPKSFILCEKTIRGTLRLVFWHKILRSSIVCCRVNQLIIKHSHNCLVAFAVMELLVVTNREKECPTHWNT
jgi:hypothetical protein